VTILSDFLKPKLRAERYTTSGKITLKINIYILNIVTLEERGRAKMGDKTNLFCGANKKLIGNGIPPPKNGSMTIVLLLEPELIMML
jgi:hypothetical protein